LDDSEVSSSVNHVASDTCLSVKKKSISKQLGLDQEKFRESCQNLEPAFVNSVDEMLELSITNPVGFCVLRTLCSKQFQLYQNQQEPEKVLSVQVMLEPKKPCLNSRKLRTREHRRKLLSSFWQAVLLSENEAEEGYLGSEEDDEYKSQILNGI
jgi:hypothetical protein